MECRLLTEVHRMQAQGSQTGKLWEPEGLEVCTGSGDCFQYARHVPMCKAQVARLHSQYAGGSGVSNHKPHLAATAGNAGAVRKALGGRRKRILDIAIAVMAMVVLAPFAILIAILIKLTMGGPVIYAHQRVGYNGRMFNCFKFRTMVMNPEETLREFLASHPDAKREWSETQKLKNDPRVTRVGHILRISSLDELPQLMNVLRGDMSCVGPRPIVEAELERYGGIAEEYLSTRPGITGLWQVSGRSQLSYDSRVSLDSEYIRGWSIWLDLRILVMTVPAICSLHCAA